MSAEAAAERLAQLREASARLGAGAFLVRDTSNIVWLTAFDDVFDDEPAHALYVCPSTRGCIPIRATPVPARQPLWAVPCR